MAPRWWVVGSGRRGGLFHPSLHPPTTSFMEQNRGFPLYRLHPSSKSLRRLGPEVLRGIPVVARVHSTPLQPLSLGRGSAGAGGAAAGSGGRAGRDAAGDRPSLAVSAPARGRSPWARSLGPPEELVVTARTQWEGRFCRSWATGCRRRVSSAVAPCLRKTFPRAGPQVRGADT